MVAGAELATLGGRAGGRGAALVFVRQDRGLDRNQQQREEQGLVEPAHQNRTKIPASISAWNTADPLATIRQAPSPSSDRQKKEVSVSTAVR